MPTPQEVETTELMENVTLEIGGDDPAELDDLTKDKSFRKATAQLLVGEITVPEWEWFARRAINRKVDLPFLIEANERQLFEGAFELLGTALEGLLLQQESDFRTATADLLRGDMATDDWLDVAGDVLDGLVDVPYVPPMGEDLVLDRGLDVIAQALHGLLVGSSESA